MTANHAFWDRVAEKYSRRPVPDEAVYQHKLEVTRRYFDADSQVLEIGCGTGTTAIYHAPFVKHLLATDISPKMIEIARDKAAMAGVENVDFEVSSIDALEIPDGSVDVVLGLSILHLVEDRQTVIDAVHRMLRPGGVFVSSTVCMGDKLKFFKFIAPIGRFLGLIPLVKVFNSAELRDSISAGGFEIDYDYKPENSHALFLIAKKPE